MTDETGLPQGAGTWWNYLYASCVLLVCLIVCLVGGAMFAKTSAAILLVCICMNFVANIHSVSSTFGTP